MKAKEWVAKLQNVPEPESEQPVEERFASFIDEYGKEIVDLVEFRTKFSKPESRFSASEGAVREQREKFRVICNSFPALTGLFDPILEKVFPEWKKMLESHQKQQQ